jgi:hypothetical protein
MKYFPIWTPFGPGLISEFAAAKESLKNMANRIHDNHGMRAAIRDASPHLRRAVYDQLAPLMKFKVKPYLLLKP